LADFDGDGRLDLLSGSHCCDPFGFHLFRRQQDGSWAPRQRLEVRPPQDKQSAFLVRSVATAADWNGDGTPDLLFASAKFQGIGVAFGPFAEKEPLVLSHRIRLTHPGTVFAIAVADWDGDGRPDLLVGQHVDGKGRISWYRNLGGAGVPRLADERLLLEDPSPDDVIRGFCVCDWNADGRADLVVTRDVAIATNPQGERVQWRGMVWLYLRE
jgi:hypothetical protein